MATLTREERKEKQKEFTDSIRSKICDLASVYHNGDDCCFFREPQSGSYNVCFFVQFFRQSGKAHEETATSDEGPKEGPKEKPDGDRWVVRVPFEIRLAIEPWEKVETEITTMRCVFRYIPRSCVQYMRR